jgi:hypothetical protein
MNKILETRFFLGIMTLAMGLLTAQKAFGGDTYLSQVGPSSLRFEAPAVENPIFLAELALPKPKADEPIPLPKVPVGQDKSGSANADSAENPGGIFAGLLKNAQTPASPASDMLNMTPQMIVEYLKPNRSEGPRGDEPSPYQPGQSIVAPDELNFLPPLPGGNRAIYISK